MRQAEDTNSLHVPKIFVLCNQREIAPVWGYILRQQGLQVILETSVEKVVDRWSAEMPDLLVIDIDVVFHLERMELYRKIRAMSANPILFILPTYHENQILKAYAAGVDDVAVKPISPPVFLAKIMAWICRNWIMPDNRLNLIHAGKYKLLQTRRCLISSDGQEIKLTNLEFCLLQLLMSRSGHIFPADDIIQAIWDGYGDGDRALLKNVVYRLRKKIEKDPGSPVLLQTGPIGYSFQG